MNVIRKKERKKDWMVEWEWKEERKTHIKEEDKKQTCRKKESNVI